MELGAFSVSLSVKDMAASRRFYETLGFTVIGGDGEEWLILRGGGTTIGLFHGLFEGNILTFNPGWSTENETLADFTDVRALKEQLTDAGFEINGDTTAETDIGPASFMLEDPDGNVILVDQHR